MDRSYPTFHDAYRAELAAVRDEPEFRNAPRGFASAERLGVAFRIEDPRARVPLTPARRANLVFDFAEALWYCGATDDLAQIGYYAPFVRRFSADGRTLRGTAYGPRIFALGRERRDQWRAALDTIRADPDTKRAAIQIFEGGELADPANIDVACTLGLQFLLRDGRLHAVAYMRANDAYRGVVSDVFSFTFLQELAACELGVEVGAYHHVAGTFHIYDSDRAAVDAVLADERRHDAGAFPAMPAGDNWPHVRAVLGWEALLRADEARLTADDIAGLDLPEYWRDVVALLELYRQVVHRTSVDHAVLDGLPPLYRALVLERWGEAWDVAASARSSHSGLQTPP